MNNKRIKGFLNKLSQLIWRLILLPFGKDPLTGPSVNKKLVLAVPAEITNFSLKSLAETDQTAFSVLVPRVLS